MPSTDTINTRSRYGAVAIALHWAIAFGIVFQLVLGPVMTSPHVDKFAQFRQYQLHKSIGITVLLLMLARLAWRLGHKPPPLPADMPVWERKAAHFTHVMFYVLGIGMPLVGWALVSSSPLNLPTVLYGIIPWPHLPILSTLTDKAPVEAVFKVLHDKAGFLLLLLVLLHVAAALRHQFFKGDGVLGRMIPVSFLRARSAK